MHPLPTAFSAFLDREEGEGDAEVEGLLAQRQEARRNRDFEGADALRDAIREARLRGRRHPRWPQTQADVSMPL